MNRLSYALFVIIACLGCTNKSGTEKYQKNRDRIADVRDRVKEIEIENPVIGSNASLFLMDQYLIIVDYKSQDKLIHIFDKNTFNHITSIADRGQGPGEIANIGHIGVDEANRMFYVSDHGKQCIFKYNLDSVFMNPLYIPEVKMKMDQNQFPGRYQYINDTLCIGLIIEPIGSSDFKPTMAKWNMRTKEIKLMKYEHPEIEKKRVCVTASVENGIYVECYYFHDLMTICNLNGDGSLKYNIYGKNWSNQKTNKVRYYESVAFCGDKIVALYSGQDTFSKNEKGEITSNTPTKFIVFDLNGDYIQTLETGFQITNFCYDATNNRIIMNMDDEIQFAYLDVDELTLL